MATRQEIPRTREGEAAATEEQADSEEIHGTRTSVTAERVAPHSQQRLTAWQWAVVAAPEAGIIPIVIIRQVPDQPVVESFSFGPTA
jgi:hypothetical protein